MIRMRDVTAQITANYVGKLTQSQRRLLVDHVDGPKSVEASSLPTTMCLIRARLLCNACPAGVGVPRRTRLTEAGRAALGFVLAEYAEALIRAERAREADATDAL